MTSATVRERIPLIERYRDRLPLEPGDPVVTLVEGSTPLVPAPRLSERIGVETHLKFEGMNPTGSFKDRGMTVAVSRAVGKGAEAIICASTGNTAASCAAYAARAGIRGAVLVPEGKIARGKLAQAVMHGARVISLRGNFDQALELVKQVVEHQPIELVNSINPYRIEGQKTAAFEVCDELGAAPDALAIPVGNAGNVTAWWKGFVEYGQGRPALYGFQAEGAAPIVLGRPVEQPETVASAIRIGNPARWQEAVVALDESGGRIAAVSDREIIDAQRWLASHEGVFCEPASAACVAGVLKSPPAGAALLVCVLTGHGLKDPETALEAVPEVIAVDPDLREVERAVLAWEPLMGRRRRVRVPGSSANLGPGFDSMAAAVSLHLELEVEETGEFSVDPGDPALPADESNLCVRAFAELHAVEGLSFRVRSEIPLEAGLGSSGAAIVAALIAADHMYELALPREEVFARAAAIEGHPDNVAASLYGGFVVCAAGNVTVVEPPAGLEAIAVVPSQACADRRGPRRAARRGAAGRRDLQRRARGDARARPCPRRPGADRTGTRGPAASTAPPPPVPAIDGPGGARARSRRAGGDDLRRGTDGALLGLLRADRRGLRPPARRGRRLGGGTPAQLRGAGRGRAEL